MHTTSNPILVYTTFIDDWFVLEPAVFNQGQPEGDSEEWREILEAMHLRKNKSFKRVAVMFENANAYLHSPKNSDDPYSYAIFANELDRWIAQAHKILDAYCPIG